MKKQDACLLISSMLFEPIGVDGDGTEVEKTLPLCAALIGAGVEIAGWTYRDKPRRKVARFLCQLAAALEETAAGSVAVLAEHGMLTKAAHHKQWYLAQIARACGVDMERMEREQGHGFLGVAP